MATKMGPTDIIFVKLRAMAFKSRSKSDRDGEKIGTLRRILGQHKKVLDVQGAILVVKKGLAQCRGRLMQAWRRVAQLAGEGFGLPRDTIQVSHSLTKVRGLRQTI